MDYKAVGLTDDFPDGMTIDTDGNLWVANYNGAKVNISSMCVVCNTRVYFSYVLDTFSMIYCSESYGTINILCNYEAEYLTYVNLPCSY